MKKKYIGTVATNKPDRNGERFSDEALAALYEQAIGAPLTIAFMPPSIGHVEAASLYSAGYVEVCVESDLPDGLYAVPGFLFDPETVTYENGVKVYHEIKLTSFGLTRDPADKNLSPLEE